MDGQREREAHTQESELEADQAQNSGAKKRTPAGCASGEPVWIKAVSAMAVCKKRRIEAEGDVADMNLANAATT